MAALFLAGGGETGAWAMARSNGMQDALLLLSIPSSDEGVGQSVAAALLNAASGHETGRGLLGPAISSGALNRLLQDERSTPTARACAAACLAKIGIAAKALDSSNDDTGRLLATATELLKVADPEAHGEAATEARLLEARMAADRAVEVLSYLCTKTAVKEELTSGSGRCVAALERLGRLESMMTAGDGLAYGLAHIYMNMSVTVDELHREALAEKEMTPEQYEQLKKLQETHGQKLEDGLATDSVDQVGRRVQRMVDTGAIQTLLKVISVSSATSEGSQTQGKQKSKLAGSCLSLRTAARAFANMACIQAARGRLLAAGVLPRMSTLATFPTPDGLTTKEEKDLNFAKAHAAHCIAKLLVTTNPAGISENTRLGTIPGLINTARFVDATNLMQFEILLALTNLASVGETEQNTITSKKHKGLQAIGYLQTSDHRLVRRAATECLANLAATESFRQQLQIPERIKLWIAFAEDWDDGEFGEVKNEDDIEVGPDYKTACAAAGALAMATIENPEACDLHVKEGAATAIHSLLSSGKVELMHRAAYWALNIARFGGDESKTALSEANLEYLGMLKTIAGMSSSVAESLDEDQRRVVDVIRQPSFEPAMKLIDELAVELGKDR
eukprot:scaffold347_cov239-Pinguiococcus_pyrenoidosus.AAC.11